MAKEKSTPPKARGSALSMQPIEAMESRQLLSATFMHALRAELSAPASQPATFVPSYPSTRIENWEARFEANFDGGTSTVAAPATQTAISPTPDRFGGGWMGDAAGNAPGFAPMRHDLLHADAGDPGSALPSDGSPIIVATTIVWSTSSMPGASGMAGFDDSGNPLAGAGLIYQHATYIITYGTFQLLPEGAVLSHGPHFDGDFGDKSAPDAPQAPSAPSTPAAPAASDGSTAPTAPPSVGVGRVEPHLARPTANNNATEVTNSAPALPAAAALPASTRSVEVATIKAAPTSPSASAAANVVTGGAAHSVAQAIFALAESVPQASGVVGEALALTGASAAATPPAEAIVAGAQTVIPPIGAIAQTAAVAQAALHVNAINAMGLFSDALGAFINDSVALEPAGAVGHAHRAWAITAGVVTFDAILVGHWYAQRAKQKEEKEASPFRDGKPMLADLPLVE